MGFNSIRLDSICDDKATLFECVCLSELLRMPLPWTTFRLKRFLFDTKLNIYVCDRWPVSMSKYMLPVSLLPVNVCKECVFVTFSYRSNKSENVLNGQTNKNEM